jgi:hypothetical protein
MSSSIAPQRYKKESEMQKVVRKIEKSLAEYKQSKGEQLQLFQMLASEDERYSNTVELYDFIPKYVSGKPKRVSERFLEAIKKDFEFEGKAYHVRVTPARMDDKDGVSRDYFPGVREEIVEAGLRKLACDENHGYFLDDELGVLFTLYELQQVLKQYGHTYSLDQIKEALLVCKMTNVELRNADGSAVVITSLFETVGLATREDWKGQGQKTKAFVRFNPLVTRSVKSDTFRRINYAKSMSFKSVVARRLHMRLSHCFRQASARELPAGAVDVAGSTYGILLSTIIRDFGLTRYKQIRDNLRDVEMALKELIEQEVVLDYKVDLVYSAERKNKIEDAKISIRTHYRFGQELRRSNGAKNDIRALIAKARTAAK